MVFMNISIFFVQCFILLTLNNENEEKHLKNKIQDVDHQKCFSFAIQTEYGKRYMIRNYTRPTAWLW